MATSKENLEMQTDQARMTCARSRNKVRFGGAKKPKQKVLLEQKTVASQNALQPLWLLIEYLLEHPCQSLALHDIEGRMGN